MADLQLFIGGAEADLPSDAVVAMTYEFSDAMAPAAVKNSFSKSVRLPATPANAAIFGLYERDDRRTATGFNALKRVDFELRQNGDTVESGYIKLDTVETSSTGAAYNITLYGGLGDFLQNLEYDEDGDKKTLASLDWGITDANGIGLPSDTEMDFTIDHYAVGSAWAYISARDQQEDWTNKQIWDTINFVPAYNGVPDDFQADKAVAKTGGDLSDAFPSTKTIDGTTYSSVGGFVGVELKHAYDEWQMRDLRSYLQRPCVSMRRFMEAIQDPANNGGYSVNLTASFFGTEAFKRLWLALPLLSSYEGFEDAETTGAMTAQSEEILASTPVVSVETGDLASAADGTLDLSGHGSGTTIAFKQTYRLTFTPDAACTQPRLYLYWYDSIEKVLNGDKISITPRVTDTTGATAIGTGATTSFLNMTTTVPSSGSVVGAFVRQTDGSYLFTDETGATTFQAELPAIQTQASVKLQILAQWGGEQVLYIRTVGQGSEATVGVTGAVDIVPVEGTATMSVKGSVTTGTKVTKAVLLATEKSPADYLLALCKRYGLAIVKSRTAKTIDIVTRAEYFNGADDDLADRVEAVDGSAKPYVIEDKWYRLQDDVPETYYSARYAKTYARNYGAQKIDTGYEFGSDTVDIYEGGQLNGAVMVRASDTCFRNYYSAANSQVMPAALLEGLTAVWYAGGTADGDKGEAAIGTELIDLAASKKWYYKAGMDRTPKPCYYTVDDGERKQTDFGDVLFYYRGSGSPMTADGTLIHIYITDDVPAMQTLEGGRCWVITDDGALPEGSGYFAQLANDIPNFARTLNNASGEAERSLDFGTPKETYVTGEGIGEQSSIYTRYWKRYLTDRLDVDARVLTVKMRIRATDDIAAMMRRFHWFRGCWWQLNKVTDWDASGEGETSCEFVKVKDRNNYRG